MLKEAEEAELNDYKILLLGAGESGKSTVVKQIKMLQKVSNPGGVVSPCVATNHSLYHGNSHILLSLHLYFQGGISASEKSEVTVNIRRNVIETMQVRCLEPSSFSLFAEAKAVDATDMQEIM